MGTSELRLANPGSARGPLVVRRDDEHRFAVAEIANSARDAPNASRPVDHLSQHRGTLAAARLAWGVSPAMATAWCRSPAPTSTTWRRSWSCQPRICDVAPPSAGDSEVRRILLEQAAELRQNPYGPPRTAAAGQQFSTDREAPVDRVVAHPVACSRWG